MPTVCAVVLTRDRKHLLAECVRGLLGQSRPVDRLVIVDNASSDGTEEHLVQEGLLADERVRFERLERNTGGAGGFAAGVELALREPADWLWLMDDDSEPRPDALARLLESPAADDPGTAALAGAVRDPSGSLELLHRGHVGRLMRVLPGEEYAPGSSPTLGFASFVGFFVRAEVARAVGLPRAELFIGCDDVDYSIRVREHGAIRLVPESEIVHKPGMGGGAVTRRSRLWNRLLGLDYTSASWSGYWKNLYGIRNFVWIRHRYGRVSAPGFAALVGAYVVKSLLYDPRPLRRVPWIVRFAWKGRRGDFTGPSPADWARLAGSG